METERGQRSRGGEDVVACEGYVLDTCAEALGEQLAGEGLAVVGAIHGQAEAWSGRLSTAWLRTSPRGSTTSTIGVRRVSKIEV